VAIGVKDSTSEKVVNSIAKKSVLLKALKLGFEDILNVPRISNEYKGGGKGKVVRNRTSSSRGKRSNLVERLFVVFQGMEKVPQNWDKAGGSKYIIDI
jgi:hypothetical protein